MKTNEKEETVEETVEEEDEEGIKFVDYAYLSTLPRGDENYAALRAYCYNSKNGHIWHPGADMVTYPQTVVSHDGWLTYLWMAVSNSGRRCLSRNTTFQEC